MKITRHISHILEIIQNLWIDLLIQRRFLAGTVESNDNAGIVLKTESTRYDVIDQVFFKYIAIKENDVIVDVGCGKGRVFNYLLYKGVKNKMIGYEINPSVGLKTQKSLSKYKNVAIITQNIFDNFPSEANIFYLYNPFKEPMVQAFKENIWEIRKNDPVILYVHPVNIDVFDDSRFTYRIVEIPFLQYTISLAIIRIAK